MAKLTASLVGDDEEFRTKIGAQLRSGSVGVRLLEDGREIGHATMTAPGGGAEATAEFRVIPSRAGLAVWTAVADSIPGS